VNVDINHAANEAVLLAARRDALEDAQARLTIAAQQTVHVITGNLRRSIGPGRLDAERGEAEVEAKADYAIYEHNGTRYRSGHPFFHEAIDRETIG
jgi:HK97 gp10 family phage protein